MIVAIKMIGIFLGVFARSLAPYLRKLREGKIKGFERRHLVSSIGSLVLGIIITLLIFPQFQAAAPNGLNAYIRLFCTAFGFGFGWHAIVSEAASWGGFPYGRGMTASGFIDELEFYRTFKPLGRHKNV